MVYLLTGFLLCFSLPLFLSSSRVGLWGLAGQALIASVILLRDGMPVTAASGIQLADVALVRGVLVPLTLLSILRQLKIRPDFNLLPPNLVLWTVAVILMISGYWFGGRLYPGQSEAAMLAGTAASAIMAGFFVIGTQRHLLGQIVAVLMIDNGVILLETQIGHSEPWPIQLGIAGIFVWFAWVLGEFLKNIAKIESTAPADDRQEVL